MDRNKIRSGNKIQNGDDRKFSRLTSCLVIQPLAIGILGIIGCFVAIMGMAAMSIASAKSQNAYCFFRISTEPPKRLLDHRIFGHTHHWSHS